MDSRFSDNNDKSKVNPQECIIAISNDTQQYPTVGFSQLPKDILVLILDYFNYVERAKLARVNKNFRQSIYQKPTPHFYVKGDVRTQVTYGQLIGFFNERRDIKYALSELGKDLDVKKERKRRCDEVHCLSICFYTIVIGVMGLIGTFLAASISDDPLSAMPIGTGVGAGIPTLIGCSEGLFYAKLKINIAQGERKIKTLQSKLKTIPDTEEKIEDLKHAKLI